jgi:hypothetical protein
LFGIATKKSAVIPEKGIFISKDLRKNEKNNV